MAPIADADAIYISSTSSNGVQSPRHSIDHEIPNANGISPAGSELEHEIPAANGLSPVNPELEPSRIRPDVLYCLRLTRQDEESAHYLDQPFSGIKYGGAGDDAAEQDDFDPAAIILEADVKGVKEPDFANSTRDWWKKPIRPDFHKKLGYEPLRDLILSVMSKRLRTLLSAIIDYDPSQHSRGYHDYYADDELSFPGLLIYYDEMKSVLASFVQSDLAKEQDQSQVQTLVAQLGTFCDTSSVSWGPPHAKVEPLPSISDIQTACDLSTLLRILTHSYERTVLPALHKLQKPDPHIEFRHLWMIYKPGTIVYREFDGSMSAYVVASATLVEGEPFARDHSDRVTRYIINIWNLIYDGRLLKRQAMEMKIEEFRAPRALESLGLAPANWHDKADGGQTAAKIKHRGKKFREFIEQGCSHRLFKHANSTYEGPVILDPIAYSENRDLAEDARDILSGVDMLDHAASEPLDTKGYRRFRGYTGLDTSDPKQAEGITDGHLFLLEGTISGLALTTKRWMRFDVEGIQEGSPFSDEDQLETILTMEHDADREVLQTIKRKATTQFSEHFTLTPDFIPGKGEGQVFLLYGGPGTGKTLSVECVANDTKRPLLSLTMSDLAPNHDSTLRRWFSLGAKWGALIIIDEADVFLTKRTDSGRDPDQLTTGLYSSISANLTPEPS